MTTPEPTPEELRADAVRRAEDALLADLLAPGKINLPGNVQVASVPSGNFRPSPPEESPVDTEQTSIFQPDAEEQPALPQVTVSLSLTVPGEDVARTVSRLSATLSAALVEDAAFSRASLDLYVNDPETEE